MNNNLEHKTLATNKLETLPQFDIKVEQAVLYCLFHDKKAREDINKLGEEDFYDNLNRQLFREMNFSDENFNVLTIPTKTKTSKAYLRLFNENYLLSYFDIYLSRLKELTAKRKLESICYKATIKIREGKELSDLKNNIVKEIEDIDIKTNKNIIDIKEVDLELEEYFKDINKKVIKTGFGKLDSFISGFQKGVFYIIGGVPGVGKTTYILNFINNVCKGKYNVLFVSLEMPRKKVEIRLISGITGINPNRIENFENEKDDNIREKIKEARIKIYDYNLKFIVSKKTFVYEIDDAIKSIGNVDIVFIDYLQKIRTNEGINAYEKVSVISSDIGTLALKHDIPIVVVASVNRGYVGRVTKEPMLSDLRDSGNLEFDAGVVLLLHRVFQFDDKADRNEAKVILAKNRYGVSNINIDLVWKPEQSKFYERELRYEKEEKERKDIY